MLLLIEKTLEGADPQDVLAVVFELWRKHGNTPLVTPLPAAPQQVFSALGGHDRGGRSKSLPKRRDPVREQQSLEILEFLNAKTGRNYRPVVENLRFIYARLNTCSVEDVKGVIARQCREWLNTPQEKYLRPATLFNATKFEQYLGEQRRA